MIRQAIGTLSVAALVLLGGTQIPGYAQRAPGASSRIYNPQTVETIKGKVVSVERLQSPRSGQSVHFTLREGQTTIPVHLGPAWFVDQQTLKIRANDTVQVTGSRVTLDGKAVLIASEVRKGNEVMQLRRSDGTPLWAGRR